MSKKFHIMPVLAIGIAMLSTPGVASADDIIINPVGASLVAKGAGILVSLTAICDPSFSNLSMITNGAIYVTQRNGNTIVQAFGSFDTSLVCDGTGQPLQVLVTPTNGAKAFKSGSALVQGSYEFYSSDFSVDESGSVVTETLKVK
jgi:hypothetical protein